MSSPITPYSAPACQNKAVSKIEVRQYDIARWSLFCAGFGPLLLVALTPVILAFADMGSPAELMALEVVPGTIIALGACASVVAFIWGNAPLRICAAVVMLMYVRIAMLFLGINSLGELQVFMRQFHAASGY
jgi:hypothetical protein